ncbi:MAG: polyketide cyclase [Erysipelothrix sp.]|nr:polyketide cyclase [Erysipelothrix sp.]
MKNTITVTTIVNRPLVLVWETWNDPHHIVHWNFASDDWHSPSALNDFVEGGSFAYEMAAKDNSASFVFGGRYTQIIDHERISYTMADGRMVSTEFTKLPSGVKIETTFEAEETHSIIEQQQGWQAILDHFKEYTESLNEID